ncbi:hypothetical protein CLG96_10475 [Sphingomonas oleivorans]|uniref:DUF983 domain-containing protein n=1 Tax=Sphingomonas oleivorans TaxID=1735121 RepID=A0A2T5FXK7_9SPHN|nr:DUF983 domain-containing protein [Sphingomonas oleivorans]PTQ10814.1 hypothetical protein CLG96_10475 [Sphingomonas oleivorans]
MNDPVAPSPIQAGLRGLCPRCGAPGLFLGAVRFAPRCRVCGLDFSSFNVGDGPAAFLTLILGALISAIAILFERTVHPPFWLHLLLWVPLTIAAVVGAMRLSKGALIALEYRNAAREGRIVDRP